MLHTVSSQDAVRIIHNATAPKTELEEVRLSDALGRICALDIVSSEYVPGFDRSSVDGYSVIAQDTFGCSESMPALLQKRNETRMGNKASVRLQNGQCAYTPTGGALADGADAVVMIEHTETFDEETVGVLKSPAPGENIVFKGDDVRPGDILLKKGHCILPADIGVLAAAGFSSVSVLKRLRVAVISTGDELVDVASVPGPGQVRNVNSSLLCAMLASCGAESVDTGIIRDDAEALESAVKASVQDADMVLISGGSSAGVLDNTANIISSLGRVHFHGIAVKPGKPTIFGTVLGKPVFGLPGHPGAAFFVFEIFVKEAIHALNGRKAARIPVRAKLMETINKNHGREQYGAVRLKKSPGELLAYPIRSKSGLISALSGCDAYYYLDRNCEGVKAGNEISVYLLQEQTDEF